MPTAIARAAAQSAGEFVFFDLETTGLSPRGDRIIEIAGLRVGARARVTDSFHALVRIDAPVPAFVTSLTGITDDMLCDQEPIEATLPRFIDFVDGRPLVSYNVSFDMGFLRAAAVRLGMRVDNAQVCALQLARKKLPDLPDHRLATIAGHFGVARPQNHRALDDCEMGLHVFVELLRQ